MCNQRKLYYVGNNMMDRFSIMIEADGPTKIMVIEDKFIFMKLDASLENNAI